MAMKLRTNPMMRLAIRQDVTGQANRFMRLGNPPALSSYPIFCSAGWNWEKPDWALSPDHEASTGAMSVCRAGRSGGSQAMPSRRSTMRSSRLESVMGRQSA
jgi:hypothetical protein